MSARFPLIVTLFLSIGCMNPYSKFYQGPPNARLAPQYDSEANTFQIYSTDNFERDVMALMKKGFQPIGQSSFNTGESAPEWQLRAHAKAIGAHVALIATRYTNTVSGAAPISVPQVQTSYSQGSATAYGSGGWANAYGNATTSTYGSQMVMVPYSVARHDVSVVYLAKVKTRVGINPVPIDDETRRRLQSNAGVKVEFITDDTPAFAADILPGDILLAIEGNKVNSMEHYFQLLDTYEGKSVSFELDRDGTRVVKQLQIRSYPKSSKQDGKP